MKRKHRARRPRQKQRGSALLVSLMIMVGLSLLGLGYVAITETENTISTNERNNTMTAAVAEAGARVVLEWFQAPTWARTNNLMPVNVNTIKTRRTLGAVMPHGAYTGYYKPDLVNQLLCDKPFKPANKPDHRFYGTENTADVIITEANSADFLRDFNAALFPPNGSFDTIRITDIRIYAPPIVGGELNGSGFWEGGSRYGLATIRVTASMVHSGRTIATRWVKLIVSEWPFPGPQGPVQSNANISTGGNFGVHWGRMTSERDMEIKRPLIGLPWVDAWQSLPFEYGYYEDDKDSLGNPRLGSGFVKQYNWMYKMIDLSLEDPWYQARAKRRILNPIAGTANHPFKFDDPAEDVEDTGSPTYSGWSNWFQNQDRDDFASPPGQRDLKMVIFPKIDYEFWKNLSQSASKSTGSVQYLRWTGDEDFTDGVETKKFAKWVNTARATEPAKAGFYFFDTRNGLNPQGAGAPGVLTPNIDVNSSDDGSTFMMKGFIYLNAAVFGTTGIRGPGGWFNFPGEPFRDIGYKKARLDGTDWERDAASAIVIDTTKASNGEWDYQELNGNGQFDLFLVTRTFTPPGSATPVTRWMPKEWSAGCRPGFNGVAGANCSEPHEPYLNLVYPVESCCAAGGAPEHLVIGWQDPTAVTKRPIKKNTAGTPIACDGSLVPDQGCTHNGYNRDGPLVEDFGSVEPIMDGVLYNEGAFDTAGNAAYFGSILINGDIIGTGTPEVWFDEFLTKGGWQDKFTDLPRVYVTAHETDN